MNLTERDLAVKISVWRQTELMDAHKSTVASGSGKPECIHCGKRHGGNVCWRAEGKCLRCGCKDHRLKECPNLKTKFIPRSVSSAAIKEQGLAGDDLDDVIVGSGKPECIHCGKRHGGNVCWRAEGKCLRCGCKDHRLKECPNMKTKFIPRSVSSAAIKEQGLAGDDLDDVIAGETGVATLEEGIAKVDLLEE
ncbi:hypothetical protein Taro_035948 [Colocasia esculenta]|uniref:CCHC-type domain-containing protein n=1 Tax=Colocasia esculenta TaxID=4460 RepID=A0A843VVZ7_COLES|nr:hypothetical protein [Colocasia esculenta]